MRPGTRSSLKRLAAGGITSLEALAEASVSSCSLLQSYPQLCLQSLASVPFWSLQLSSPISTSAHNAYQFETHLRKPVPKAKLLNQTNYKAWRLTDYDVKLGEQMILRSQQKGRSLLDQMPRPLAPPTASSSPPPDLDAADVAARAARREASALDLQRQAVKMLIAAGDVMEMKYILQELGQGLNSFCLVAAISRLPKLAKVKPAAGLGNPARIAGQILDKLLPRLEEQITRSAVTQEQMAIVLYALGELSYLPYQRLQEQLTDGLQHGASISSSRGSSSHGSVSSSSNSSGTSRSSSSSSSSHSQAATDTSGPLATLDSRRIASAMLGIAKLRLQDEQLWQVLEAAVIQRLDGLPPVTVAMVIKALTVANRAQSPLWEVLGHQVLDQLPEYGYELLGQILHNFTHQKVVHEPLFEGAWEVLAPLLEPGPTRSQILPPQAHAYLVIAYSVASPDPDVTAERMELLCQAARENLLAFDCRQVEQLATGMAQANFKQDTVLIKLLGDLVHVRGSAQFGMKHIGHMLHLLARLHHDSSSDMWRQLAVSTARMVPHMQLDKVSWVLSAYARVQRNAREEGGEEGAEVVSLAAAPVVHAAALKLRGMLEFGLPADGSSKADGQSMASRAQGSQEGGRASSTGEAEGDSMGVRAGEQPLAQRVVAAALANSQALSVLPELDDVVLMILRNRGGQ